MNSSAQLKATCSSPLGFRMNLIMLVLFFQLSGSLSDREDGNEVESSKKAQQGKHYNKYKKHTGFICFLVKRNFNFYLKSRHVGAHTCNSRTWEAEARRLQLEASLG